jgi:hypothetical protein
LGPALPLRDDMAIWIGSLFIAAMILAALAFYTLKANFSHEEQTPAVVVQKRTNKLSLEIPKTASPAPEFELRDPAGKQVSLKDLR